MSGRERTQCQRLKTQFKSTNQWYIQISIAVVILGFTMSGQFDPNMTMYSDEASVVNGNNGETTLPLVNPQVVKEPKTGLVPQAQAQPVAGLFSDQRIFMSAPQYH